MSLIFNTIQIQTIKAKEDDYSFSSPETLTYISNVKSNVRRQLFNNNWKFVYGDQSNAENNAYDDSSWRDIQLPHDYSLELDYSKQGEAESGYKLGGIGWYRKSFTLDKNAKDKRVLVEFGGVYMNATIFINGHKLGEHPNGYTPFAYDLSEYINYEGENVIAVKVDHKFPSSRWYSGSGIYRNVHLTVTDQVYVDHYGVVLDAPNLENELGATVNLSTKTQVVNDTDESRNLTIIQELRTKDAETVVSSAEEAIVLDAKTKEDISVNVSVNNPTLWNLDNPYLYDVVTIIKDDDQILDEVYNDYGFRSFKFTSDEGFFLNNKAVKLKGVSMHSDQGSLGAAAHYRAMERQVEILQDMGVNAIRVTHNPAADELIEISNRKGMLVIDEAFDTWIGSKNGNYNDYAVSFNKKVGDNPLIGAKSNMTWAEFDIKTMVRRGINAPSIISWSVGNEVMEGNSGPYGSYPDILRSLAEWVAEVDQSRPATIGDNKLKANWSEAIRFGEVLTELDGTVGFNYADGGQFDSFHQRYPEWKMYGAETASSINSRGVYKPSNYDRHLTSYDESKVGWGKLSADSWYDIITRDFMAGEFVWTGFDYLGEPTPHNNVGPGATGEWPSPKSSYFGIVDTAGLPKDRFYFYQSQWNEDVNTLHILPAWKKDMVQIDNQGNVRVDVYSDASKVELFFEDLDGNKTSLGTKEFTKHTTDAGHSYQVYEGSDKSNQNFRNLYLTWQVPYADGSVYAVAYDENDNIISDTEGRSRVETFDTAKSLSASADRTTIVADNKDLAYITIDVLDKNGKLVDDANNLINVSVDGNATLLALDNGDQVDHEPYNSGKRKAFSGKLVAIVKAHDTTGSFNVNVSSAGLESTSVTVKLSEDTSQGTEKSVIAYELPKNYYVKLGYTPNLTNSTTLYFNNDTTEDSKITWNLTEGMFDNVGTVNVTGTVEGHDLLVSTNVTVIESVGAILNYSTAVNKNVEHVNLPSSRPIILENGEILQTELPVQWESQDSNNYKEEGLVTIKGTTKVFGETFDVSASVRVAEADVEVGANIAPNYLELKQDIPEDLQSDNLLAIVDGDRGFKTVSSGPNSSVWTNYDMAQTGINTSEITFTFATAQFIGDVDLYFYQDAWASRLPENVELYWSNEGTDDAVYSPITYTETKGETSSGTPNTTKVNYSFDAVPAVAFKLVITSNPGSNAAGKKLAVGLTEAELNVVTSSLVVNKSAELDSMTLNGVSVNQAELDRKVIKTQYQFADVEALSDKNVAITVLEEQDKIIRVITESEDHLKREVYEIHLDQDDQGSTLPAESDLRDYPYSKTSATAGAYHQNHNTEGHPKYAVDNDEGTLFHTPWAGTSTDNFWITLELEEVSKLESLRYLSRGNGTNGIVNEYIVEISLDNETWTKVSTGSWTSAMNTWSLAKFDEVVEAKYVRLSALSTYGEGAQANKFMTAKEIRLRLAENRISLDDATLSLDTEEFIYDGEEKRPKVTVTLDDTRAILTEGIDYKVTYDNNINVGEAKVVVTGIVKYTGSVEKTFEIKEDTPSLDKSVLEEKLEALELLNEDDYVARTYDELKEVMDAARLVLDHAQNQDELNDMLTKLDEIELELIKLSDVKVVEDKISEVKDLDETLYTEESYNELMEVLKTVEDLLVEEFSKEELTEALKVLEKAIDDLTLKGQELNKEDLLELIDKAKAYEEEDYTEASYKVLSDALEAAVKAIDEAETQKEINDALIHLQEALDQLKEKVDLSDLKTLLNKAKSYKQEDYTVESFEALQSLIKDIEAHLESYSKEDVIEAIKRLDEAILALEEAVTVDTSELEALIEKANEFEDHLYTSDSYKNLLNAIAVAKEALTTVSNDTELTEAIKNLQDAIDSLQLIKESVDSSKLKEKLDYAKSLNKADYTEESYQRLTEVIESVEALLSKDYSQEEIDEALLQLNAALKGLKEKEKTTEKPKDPSTSVNNNQMIYLTLMLASLSIFVIVKRRKQTK